MKSKHQSSDSSNLILPVISIIILVIGALMIIWQSTKHPISPPIPTPDISFPEIQTWLGADWISTELSQSAPLEDLKGRPRSLLKRTSMAIYNTNNRLAFIRISVMTYSDKESASERYTIQDEVIFFQLDRAVYRWHHTHIVETSTSYTDKNNAKCLSVRKSEGLQNIQCLAILQYKHHIVVVNMFPHRDYQQYLDWNEISQIFEVIDAKMYNVLNETDAP